MPKAGTTPTVYLCRAVEKFKRLDIRVQNLGELMMGRAPILAQERAPRLYSFKVTQKCEGLQFHNKPLHCATKQTLWGITQNNRCSYSGFRNMAQSIWRLPEDSASKNSELHPCTVKNFLFDISSRRDLGHPADYSIGIGSSFTRGKAAGAWGWLLT